MAQIVKRGDTYRITVSCGYDSSGKQIRQSMTYRPSPNLSKAQAEKEANRQAVLFEEAVRAGTAMNNTIKFEAAAKEWFKQMELEQNLKPRTLDRYHQLEERTYSAIGHLKLCDIRTIHIQKFINNLAEPGNNQFNGKGLSTKTQSLYLNFISDVFNYCITNGMTTNNPCKNVHTIKTQKKERTVFTLEEAQSFLEALETAPEKYRMFFNLAIFTGMRNGELLGLEWKDIDFEKSTIFINRISYYHDHQLMTGTPKTKKSERILKISKDLLAMLREYRKYQLEQKFKCGDKWVEHDRLFTTWNGEPMGIDTARNWLTKFCKKNGFQNVNVHSFRHLNASLLITNGIDVKTVSAVLGHSQTSTTLNIYAHSFAEAQAEALETVANAINLGRNNSGKKKKA